MAARFVWIALLLAPIATAGDLHLRLHANADAIHVEALTSASDGTIVPVPAELLRKSNDSESLITVRGGCDPQKSFVITAGDAIGYALGSRSCEQDVELRPAVNVRLNISGPKIPAIAQVELLTCTNPRDSGTTFGRLRSEVDANGTTTLRLPVGCVQPRLFVPGYAPHRIGNLAIESSTKDVPDARLKVGGSIVAQVVSGASFDPVGSVDVAIDDGSDPALHAASDNSEAFTRAPLHGRSDANGWVFVDGIRPGNVHLHLRTSDGIRQSTEPYGVEAAAEIVIDAIQLLAPGRVIVQLQSNQKLIDDGLQIMGVQLSPVKIAAHGVNPLRQNIDKDGRATFASVHPGMWRASAVGRLAGSTAMSLATIEFRVPPGDEVSIEMPLRHQVYQARIIGAREPLDSALLALHPVQGGPAFTFRLDSSGRFRVPLEAPTEYRATLQLKEREQSLWLELFKFSDPADELEIPLPSAEVRGLIVDGDGHPIGDARVIAEIGDLPLQNSTRSRSAEARSKEDGTFAFPYAEEGRWTIAAEKDELSSDRVNVTVDEGKSITGVKLTMTRSIVVNGTVVMAGGTAPTDAIRITAWPVMVVPGELPTPKTTTADASGHFQFSLAAKGFWAVDVVAESRDGRIGVTRVPLSAKTEVLIALPQAAGAVRFERADGKTWPASPVIAQRLIAADGAQIPFYAVGRMAPDGSRIIAGLAAGTWRFAEAGTWDENVRLVNGRTEGLLRSSFEVIAGTESRVSINTRW